MSTPSRQDGKVWDGKEKLKNGTRENVMMHKFKVKRRKAKPKSQKKMLRKKRLKCGTIQVKACKNFLL